MLQLRFFLFLLVSVSILFAARSYADTAKSFQAFTKSDSLTVWQEPGFTSDDCQPLYTDTLDKYIGKRRADFLQKRKEAEKACKDRAILAVNTGDILLVKTKSQGKGTSPIEVTTQVNYEGIPEKRKFVLAKIPSHSGIEGWVSREEISEVEERTELFNLAKPCPDCQSHQTNGLPEQTNEIIIAEQALDTSNLLFPSEIAIKKQNEIDRFVCLHRSPYGPTNDNQEFLSQSYPKFKEAAEQAEKAFGVPKQLLLCGLLAESNYKPGQESDAGAKGFAQIMPRTMETISKLPLMKQDFDGKTYDQMMKDYLKSPATKGSALTNEKVRLEDHIGSNVAAMAIYFRFLYDSQLKPAQKSGKCADCKADLSSLTRKDLYLLLTGYNGGPGYIPKVSYKKPVELRRTNPPPEETNKYIEKIEKCMEQGKETSFSETQSEIRKNISQREIEIAQLQKKIGQLQKKYKYNSEIYSSRQNRMEQRWQAIEARKTDPKVKVPAPVSPYPEPKSPDQEIANILALIERKKIFNKYEVNASFGNRMDMCKASLPTESLKVVQVEGSK